MQICRMIYSNRLFNQTRVGSLLTQVPQTPIRPPRALQNRTPGRLYYATPKTPRWRAVVKKKSNTAADVNTFFTLSSGDERKLCVFCRYVSNLDGFLGKQLLIPLLLHRSCHAADSSYEVQYYSKNTGTSILRRHLYTTHPSEWISACKSLHISIKSSAALNAVSEWDETRFNVPKEEGLGSKDKGLPSEKVPFSQEAFVDAIIAWIVSDDQVSYSSFILSSLWINVYCIISL